jgi:hypothetical protein
MTGRDDETFLERWLRRKSGATVEDEGEPEPGADARADGAAGEGAEEAADSEFTEAASPTSRRPAQDQVAEAGSEEDEAAQPERPVTDADLPDLADLDEDSDYSMFMAAGVSPDKRRAALRQLFRSPKFNVIDGLDDYCEDYTKFDPLGDIVTAEMRHHAERLLRKTLEDQVGDPDDAAVAAEAPEDGGDPRPEAAADDPDANSGPADNARSDDIQPDERSKTRDA